jgi:ATP-dependent exoDNAse (exonuclease V) beta subunit
MKLNEFLCSLAEKNKHPRDERIKFEEEPHLYYIDGSTEGYISATTLIHRFFDKFDSEKIIDKMMLSKNWSSSKYFGMSKEEIKTLWENNGKIQSSKGTILHQDIENFYNGFEIKNTSKEYHYFLDFYNTHKHLKAYRTEWMIFDETLKLAGSIDMLFIDEEGNFHIYDWKRAKEIKKENRFQKGLYPLSHLDDCNFYHYSLQLNLYRKLLKINYNIEIKSMCLVQLHPNYENYIKYECPIMEREIDLIFAQRINDLAKTK